MAARNCLYGTVPNDEIGVVKITDFGLARKLEESKLFKGPKDEQIPVVWTAFEGLVDRTWNVNSDVWSMGVIIWEVRKNACYLDG